jgi:hypothetical protein
MSDIPAFPIKDFPYKESHDGLSMRDYFAAKAMQGLLASDVYAPKDKFAENAYAMADAMLKAREA